MSDILIVEDDLDVGILLSKMMTESGYSSDVAKNTVEAKKLLKNNNYIAMILEYMLPDQDGINLFVEIHAHAETYNLPVIVVSTQTAGAQENQADYISDMSELMDKEHCVDTIREVKNDHLKQLILHIEDDGDVRQIVNWICKDIAIFEAVPSLQAAIKKLTTVQYDLIILDLELLDGSGWDLLPVFKKHQPKTPVLIFTAEDVTNFDTTKIDAVLVKSRASNEVLLQTINTMLKQKSD
jgi:DNA-binding response OmpR family regulator